MKLAVRNIKGVSIADPMKVNVKDVVKSKAVVIVKDSVNKLENRLLMENKEIMLKPLNLKRLCSCK